VGGDELKQISHLTKAAHKSLLDGDGAGNDFLGWKDLPVNYDKDEFARIKKAADKIKSDSQVLFVIGIGGSYLGARAVIEALKSTLYNNLKKSTPEIYFVGNGIDADYLNEVISLADGKDFSVNIISKSGTTTEPAVAFRVFRELAEKKYGAYAKSRIYATTDKKRGTLKELADSEGWETFVVPDDIGGRFSVLTAVGLLPIAAAGVDIEQLIKGAADERNDLLETDPLKNNVLIYAALRNIFFNKGFKNELLVTYKNSFVQFGEWYKQLFGESEGKDGKGIFPVTATFSTDLHSLGQFIQDGAPIIFETVLKFDAPLNDYYLKKLPPEQDGDGLNFLSEQNLSVVTEKAFLGTIIAHTDGGTPNIVISAPKPDAYTLGALIYFFEKACAVSGYLLGVNPFDQPGVESYKKNMFALLGKKGYEDIRQKLEAQIN
jgi:glucose-6-phosphate isomerase